MCDISCGVCLSLSLWVGVNVHIICVCLYICITHRRFSSIGILSSNFIQLFWVNLSDLTLTHHHTLQKGGCHDNATLPLSLPPPHPL